MTRRDINIQHLHDPSSIFLVTGAAGFIGSDVVRLLAEMGAKFIRAFVRPTSNLAILRKVQKDYPDLNLQIYTGNLLSLEDCISACRDVDILYHLSAGRGKSYADCFQNSVIATKRLLDASISEGIGRFVNVGSMGVYSNTNLKRHDIINESSEIEGDFVGRADPYSYAKFKQDELVESFAREYGLSYSIVRPGNVFGPGKPELTGRIGIDFFGRFLHLGGGNQIPFTFVDNCAYAIICAGLSENADGQIFNVVDDNLPSSRQFLAAYKKKVKKIRTIRVPYRLFRMMSSFWEWLSKKSDNQIPPVYNRKRADTFWKGNKYSNEKLKRELGWVPIIDMDTAINLFTEYARNTELKDA